MTSTLQLDLFGEVEAAEDTRVQELAWLARFRRVPAVALVERKGEIVGENRFNLTGWLCPDPDCGVVELKAEHLVSIHGFDPLAPGCAPSDGRCQMVARIWARPHELGRVRQLSGGGVSSYCACGDFTDLTGDSVADLEAAIEGHRRYIAWRLSSAARSFQAQ